MYFQLSVLRSGHYTVLELTLKRLITAVTGIEKMTEKSPASKAHTDAQSLDGVEEGQTGAQGDSCPDGQSNVVKGQVESRPSLVKSHSHVRNGS